MVKIKICCIKSVEEAKLAIELGASAIGLVSEMPSGPGVISENDIAEIAKTIPPPIATFLLTSKNNGEEIVAQQQRCGANTIQLCDKVEAGAYQMIRDQLPGIRLVQVVHVMDESSVVEARKVEALVDAILLDSGNTKTNIKELGGTGRQHDWVISTEIVSSVKVPVFLAGGITSDNVIDAIEQVSPFGIDLCTGVRTNGELDFHKLQLFMQKVESVR